MNCSQNAIILNVSEETQNCRTHNFRCSSMSNLIGKFLFKYTVKRIVYLAFHVERSSFTIVLILLNNLTRCFSLKIKTKVSVICFKDSFNMNSLIHVDLSSSFEINK